MDSRKAKLRQFLTYSLTMLLHGETTQGSRLTFQLASPVASDGFDPLAKTNFSLARRRTFFSFKLPIHDFHEQNNSFHLNSIRCKDRHRCYNYIGSTTITVIVTQLLNSPPENIPFNQNADSRFLVNTTIHSITTYFQVANTSIDII